MNNQCTLEDMFFVIIRHTFATRIGAEKSGGWEMTDKTFTDLVIGDELTGEELSELKPQREFFNYAKDRCMYVYNEKCYEFEWTFDGKWMLLSIYVDDFWK